MKNLDLVAWLDATKDLNTVRDVLDGSHDPPPSVRIVARRDGNYFRSDAHLSLSVKWHLLDPRDFIEPA